MKSLENVIEKIGIDKVMHVLVGAVIDAMLMPFGIEYTILGVMFVFMLSCVKELIDSFEAGNKCDWMDVLYSVSGALMMCIYMHVV